MRNSLPISTIAIGAILTLAGRGIGRIAIDRRRVCIVATSAISTKKLSQIPSLIRAAEIEITISKNAVANVADAFDGKVLIGTHYNKKLRRSYDGSVC